VWVGMLVSLILDDLWDGLLDKRLDGRWVQRFVGCRQNSSSVARLVVTMIVIRRFQCYSIQLAQL
jgi:hypothetical protein